ncbi:response regulator [Bacteroidota bacterium]
MSDYRVLIVDDEEEFVTTIAERLQIRGIETLTAIDGESALKIIDSDPPKVAVLDLMMPGLGGLDILKYIQDKNLQIPVILITGYGSTEPDIDGMKHGAFDCLMKPCDIDKLISKIQEAVKKIN